MAVAGDVPFAAGTGGNLNPVCSGITRADAAKFEPAIIVDNTDPGYSSTGLWMASNLTGFNGTSTTYASAGATSTWTPSVPSAGKYGVYVWFPYSANTDTAAKYTVVSSDGSTNVTVDQTQYAGKWRSLGIFNFAAGTSGIVTLTSVNGNTRADAAYLLPFPPQ